MRLFFALQFDEKTVEAITAVQGRLAKAAQNARLSQRENLHLTLAFLGEQPESALPRLKAAMEQTAWEPLELCIDHAGSFRRSGGDTWWLGFRYAQDLMTVQAELAGHLRAAGFKLEDRPFSPHLTLARQVYLPRDFSGESLLTEPITTRVERFTLMESTRRQGQLVYVPLYER